MANPRKPSERTIKQQIRKLRQFIDASKDPIAARLAYVAENALRWATEETAWGSNFPMKDLRNEIEILRTEIKERAK